MARFQNQEIYLKLQVQNKSVMPSPEQTFISARTIVDESEQLVNYFPLVGEDSSSVTKSRTAGFCLLQ